MASKQRVLLVDDEPHVLFVMSRRLSRKFDVSLATSVKEAMKKLDDSEPFTVVVSDMHMPGANGLDFLETLKNRAPLATRIMLTGSTEPDIAVDAVNQAEVFRFIRKPCTGDQLSTAVEDGVLLSLRQLDMLNASKQAKETLKQTTDIFSTMSHELRTPLNHIIGFAEILEQQLEGEGARRDYVSTIRESGINLNGIVNTLMDYGAVQSGQYKLDRQPVSLRDFISDCIERIRPECDEKAIHLYVDEPQEDIEISIDTQALSVCVYNLLSNAVKFSHHEGSVLLELTVDEFGLLNILVSDKGVGIEPDWLERVMEPFAKESEAFDASFGGIGMGLPLARSLVNLQGGRIELDSCLDEGTNVRIVIPAASVSTPEQRSIANVVAFPGGDTLS